jgi:hypothetical protein
MQTVCLLVFCAAFICCQTEAASNDSKAANPVEVNVPIPKGAQHIVITNGDRDLRTVFTYFPYPHVDVHRVLPLHRDGVYRIELSPEGKVTAITILRTMGKWLDYPVMKKLITWKAVPGNFRVVDVHWSFTYQPAGIRGYY